MADDITLPGTGSKVATDNDGTRDFQWIKPVWGPDDTFNKVDIASGKALPVQLRDSDGTDVALSGKLGALTETAPASDTASSGLNGRLQRIAQRLTTAIASLTSLIALLPTALVSGALKVMLHDGTNPAVIKASSIAPSASDAALVVTLSPNGLNANDAKTTPNSAPVTLPNDQAASVAATFTPAASSHTAGDCNGAATTWAAVGLSGRIIMITGASLEIDGGTAEATSWTLYLYNVTPPSATADDAAWDLPSGDRASFLGKISLGTAVDLGSTQWVETQGINKQVKLSGTALFGYLVNDTTVTTAAVAHIVTLHAVQL